MYKLNFYRNKYLKYKNKYLLKKKNSLYLIHNDDFENTNNTVNLIINSKNSNYKYKNSAISHTTI